MQTDLPIWEIHDDLINLWQTHRNGIIIAPTGSGKTTQVCQMLLAHWQAKGINEDKRIVVLQPRRVAARSVARRVADEMAVTLGKEVGYQVRYEDVSDMDEARTRICFVTEGILLRWLQLKPNLADVGAVLFDEFHERNLLGDVALAICKDVQREQRQDLLLMVMSATLEAEPIANYLKECPILYSQGRVYAVEIHYETWADDTPVWERAAKRACQLLNTTDDGDVLIFMPGAYEISRTIEVLRRNRVSDEIIVPLHGELSPQQQDRAFIVSTSRRIIVSTNIAETSVTLPNIHFVIDSGLARIARFDSTRGVDTLKVEEISIASAEQRAGRAGRVAKGVCYRLWTQENHNKRPTKNTPEIRRMDLAEVVLLLKSLGVRDVTQFDYLDKPQAARLMNAEKLLYRLGALSHETQMMTGMGWQMLRLPIHPRSARMLIESQRWGCLDDAVLFAACISGRDLFVHLDKRDTATKRNRETLLERVADNMMVGGQVATRNDAKLHLAQLHFTDYVALKSAFLFAASQGFAVEPCYKHGINPHVAREIAQAYEQIRDIAKTYLSSQAGDNRALSPDQWLEGLCRCHLVAYIDQLAVRRTIGGLEFDLPDGKQGELMQESWVGRSYRGEAHRVVVVSEIREIHTRNGDALTILGTISAIKTDWLKTIDPQPDDLNEKIEHVYDRLNKRVVAASVLRYRDLVIAGTPVAVLDPAESAWVLANEFVDKLDRIPAWRREVLPRLHLAKKQGQAMTKFSSPEWLITQLARVWYGATTFKEISERSLMGLFDAE
jgi:ATP-dependent helicase HrpB